MAGIGSVDDPRLDNDGFNQGTGTRAMMEKLHDSSIPIEEYMHYAKITRAEEDRLYGPGSDFVATAGPATAFFKSKVLRKPVEQRRSIDKPRLSISGMGEAQIRRPSLSDSPMTSDNEKHTKEQNFEPMTISDEEWVTASRAARTATW